MSREEINKHLYGKGLLGSAAPTVQGALKQKFLFPPFSVLDSRDGLWQSRKRKWLALGIQSELGRDVKTYTTSHFASEKYGNKNIGETSVFCPVLTELLYGWYCPPGGLILDPFAGGSVRGVVASILGFQYWGCDLRQEQINANEEQAHLILSKNHHKPRWVCGDSLEMVPKCVGKNTTDLLFSCPPFNDLEVYSKDPHDLSNMDYRRFLNAYTNIIDECAHVLKPNRFAVFVVAAFRDKKGVLRDLPGDTIRAFNECGLTYYADAVLVSPAGTAPVRTSNTFERGRRKLVRLHQTVLVFVKGEAPTTDWSI